MMTETPFDRICAVANRFAGISVEQRKRAATWPRQWRVSIITSKNERGAYRIVAWGDDATTAIENALRQVEWADA